MKTTLTRRDVLLGASGLGATMVTGTAALADGNDDEQFTGLPIHPLCLTVVNVW